MLAFTKTLRDISGMGFENTKMIISGGYASRPYFEAMYEVAGTEQPIVAFDISPRVTQENYDTTRQQFITAFERLGLPDPIWLQSSAKDSLTIDSLERGLEKADVLLVTGGATKHGYEKWKAAGLADHLVDRVRSGGIVAAGGSAGAMIWFSQGYSDSMMYEVPEGDPWEYVLSGGAGLFKSWVTAHHSDTDDQGRSRTEGFQNLLAQNTGNWEKAIGLDTAAALVCVNGIATVKNVSVESKPASHDVYIYNALDSEPRIIGDGDTIELSEL
jgi:peptidase E